MKNKKKEQDDLDQHLSKYRVSRLRLFSLFARKDEDIKSIQDELTKKYESAHLLAAMNYIKTLIKCGQIEEADKVIDDIIKGIPVYTFPEKVKGMFVDLTDFGIMESDTE